MRHLITLRMSPAGEATLERARALLRPLGLAPDDRYGLVCISPKRGLYVVRVEGAVDRRMLETVPEVVGVHGDAKIAPIGSADEELKGD